MDIMRPAHWLDRRIRAPRDSVSHVLHIRRRSCPSHFTIWESSLDFILTAVESCARWERKTSRWKWSVTRMRRCRAKRSSASARSWSQTGSSWDEQTDYPVRAKRVEEDGTVFARRSTWWAKRSSLSGWTHINPDCSMRVFASWLEREGGIQGRVCVFPHTHAMISKHTCWRLK